MSLHVPDGVKPRPVPGLFEGRREWQACSGRTASAVHEVCQQPRCRLGRPTLLDLHIMEPSGRPKLPKPSGRRALLTPQKSPNSELQKLHKQNRVLGFGVSGFWSFGFQGLGVRLFRAFGLGCM